VNDVIGNWIPAEEDGTRTPVQAIELRDYFAAQALAGMADNYARGNRQMLAEDCYAIADALLKARQSVKSPPR
jgi:RNA-splicing ligase RtcB